MYTKRLTFFRMRDDSSTRGLAEIYNEVIVNHKDPAVYEEEFYKNIHKFIKRCVDFGYYGNLWHCAVANLIVNSENAYSLCCEMTGDIGGSLSDIAALDFEILFDIFNISLKEFLPYYSYDYESLENFDSSGYKGKYFGGIVRQQILELSTNLAACRTPFDFQNVVGEYYRQNGVGMFSMYRAFSLESDGGLEPIRHVPDASFKTVRGDKAAINALIKNTDNFLEDKEAHSCLMLASEDFPQGELIQALCHEYYDQGLRVIQIRQPNYEAVSKLMVSISTRKPHFILYVNGFKKEDLEFNRICSKRLVQGAIKDIPPNVLVYVSYSSDETICGSDYGLDLTIKLD